MIKFFRSFSILKERGGTEFFTNFRNIKNMLAHILLCKDLINGANTSLMSNSKVKNYFYHPIIINDFTTSLINILLVIFLISFLRIA